MTARRPEWKPSKSHRSWILLLLLPLAGCLLASCSRQRFVTPQPENPIDLPPTLTPIVIPTRPLPTTTPIPPEVPTEGGGGPVISQQNLQRLQEIQRISTDAELTSLALSPKGSHLAAGTDDGDIMLWDLRRGEHTRTLKAHTHQVRDLAFSPMGDTLASGSDDRTVRLWDVETGILDRTINSGLPGRVLRVAFSPQGDLIAMAGHMCYVELRQVRDGLLRRTLAQPECAARLIGGANAYGIAFSPEGDWIATGEGRSSFGGSIVLWDTDTWESPTFLRGYNLTVQDLQFSPNGEALAAAFVGDPEFWLIDAKTGDTLKLFQGHEYRVNSLSFSDGGDLLASGSRDGNVIFWDPSNGEALRTLEQYEGDVIVVEFSADGKSFTSATASGEIILWSVP